MDKSLKKTIVKIIAIIIEVLFSIGIINIICNWNKSGEDNIPANCISILLFVIYTYIIGRKLFIKKYSNCMRAMKYFCSYREVEELIKDEKFKKIKNSASEEAYASKLWLKLGGALVPKNLIAGAYVQVATYGVFELRLILINGKQLFYRIGSDKNKIEDVVNSIKSLVSHLVLCDGVFEREKNICIEMQSKYEEKINSGATVEELINNWTGEFAIK